MSTPNKMQIKIVKYFIKSSPVGEVNLILKDVFNIVDKEIDAFLRERSASRNRSGGNKKELCRMHQAGKCTRGAACPYRHEMPKGADKA